MTGYRASRFACSAASVCTQLSRCGSAATSESSCSPCAVDRFFFSCFDCSLGNFLPRETREGRILSTCSCECVSMCTYMCICMHFEIVCEIVILVCGCVLQQVLDTARAGQENGVFPCCPCAPSLLAFRDERKECSMCLDRLGSFSSGAVPFFSAVYTLYKHFFSQHVIFFGH